MLLFLTKNDDLLLHDLHLLQVDHDFLVHENYDHLPASSFRFRRAGVPALPHLYNSPRTDVVPVS